MKLLVAVELFSSDNLSTPSRYHLTKEPWAFWNGSKVFSERVVVSLAPQQRVTTKSLWEWKKVDHLGVLCDPAQFDLIVNSCGWWSPGWCWEVIRPLDVSLFIVWIVTAWWSLWSSYCDITLTLCPLTVNLSKLSSGYTRPFLNDKLSISNHVLTMCLSPLHQSVIFRVIFSTVFSDAPFARERLKLSFRSSFDSQKIILRVIFGWVFWRGF